MDTRACAEKPDTSNRLHPDQDIADGADASGPSCHDPNRSAAFKRRSRGELAGRKCSGVFCFPARPAAMIRIDYIWLATEPMDMRAGTETALARVVAVFGAAKLHCAYLFANRRAIRMNVLVRGRLAKKTSLVGYLIMAFCRNRSTFTSSAHI